MLLLFFFVSFFSLNSFAQKRTVSGTVFDETNQPLPGVTIVEVGTANGTVTNFDGKYSIELSDNASLTFSFIGYNTVTMLVGTQSTIDLTLNPDSKELDEVVVVGYGVQRKVNLSGAVSTVNVAKMIDSRPVTNISSALAGVAPGVFVTSDNNRPSAAGEATIFVRGQGTLNNSAPLVIIDGVESSLNTINPQDVENISVLKDASSAAIYGSRAANGVILITTKTGKKGVLNVDYNGYVSFESVRKNTNTISNYADYMGYLNEGMKNSNKPEPFSANVINLWRENENNPDKLLYANSDIMDIYEVGIAQQHNISASGGSDKISFFSSFNFLDNPGVLPNTGYDRYSLRANIVADITSWFKFGTNISGYTASTTAASDNINDAYTYGLTGGNPGVAYKDAEGRLGINPNTEDDPQNASNNPYLRLQNVDGSIKTNNVKARMFAELTPIEGLTVQGSYSYEYYNNFKRSQPKFVELWNFQTNTLFSDGKGRTSIYNYDQKQYRNFMDGTVKYDRNFLKDNLSFSILGGASQEQFQDQNFGATRYDLLDPSLSVINGAIGDASASGNTTQWAMRSYFGRLNLGWVDRYLMEINFRADGSSRFLSENRWGYFPSISAAWRISNENFMKNIAWIDNLKIRASYGSLGNNSIGNYDALSLYSQTNYVLNRTVAMGLSQTAIANALLTWESTNVTNFGVDFGFLNNRFSGTIDAFNKETQGILISLPAPMVHGNASIPKQNAAQVTNKGVELLLAWNDNIGKDFTYNIGGNITYITNNVDKFRGNVKAISGYTMLLEGLPMNINYVLRTDRIIETDEDLAIVQKMLDNAPLDENGNKRTVFPYGTPGKGDLLYKDLNNDGIVNDEDRQALGSGSTPKFTYGMNFNASWKGFDLGILLQGVAGIKDSYNSSLYKTTVRLGYQINADIVEGRWYEGRTTPATYPRLLDYSITKNEVTSDFWLMSKAYMKIRNIQLGYTLPKEWTNMIQLKKVRLYGSLENFFTISKWKGYDPEISSITYPTMKQAVVGVNVTF